MSPTPLAEKDSNAPLKVQDSVTKCNVKSLEYHRQMLQSKMAASQNTEYVSPSDMLESPATSKIKALRGKQAAKMKGRSLFAQTASKGVDGQEDGKPSQIDQA